MSSATDRIDAESRKDPARLEREIDQQRADISHIVDALEDKLSPGQMFDRLVHFGKGNGREFAQNVGNAVKANPLPVLLTSIGLLWLYAGRNEPAPAPGARSDEERMVDRAGELGEEASGAVSDAWNQVRSRVTDTARGARESWTHQKDRAVEGYNHLLRDNPLALGAIGIAVGALLGAALPSTGPENRLMGEASDRLAGEAMDALHSGVDEAREAMRDLGEPERHVRH